MELKYGDKIYRCYQGSPTQVLTIDRITKTQAIAGIYKFRKKYYENSWISLIGEGSFSMTSYYLETPELIAKLKRVNMIRKLEAVKFNDLEDDKLQLFFSCI
jgi:hypothetical protein